LGCNLLAERASLLLLRPQNVIRWVRRVWGSNGTSTTTITKYNPEDLHLSKCSQQLAVVKVKAFYLQRIFTLPWCEDRKNKRGRRL